jgi:hypothetical protein
MPAIPEARPLTELMIRIITNRRDEVRINPTWVAHAAMLELDPLRAAPPLVYLAANLEMRQIARGLCRDLFEEGEVEEAKDDLFPDLQWRYPQPRRRGEEPSYVLREYMDDRDIAFNVARLRSEAQAKLDHADALESWGRRRKRAS